MVPIVRVDVLFCHVLSRPVVSDSADPHAGGIRAASLARCSGSILAVGRVGELPVKVAECSRSC